MAKICITCPKCNTPFKVDEKHIGKRGICSKCGERFVIPKPLGSREAAPEGTGKQSANTQTTKPEINFGEQVSPPAKKAVIEQGEPFAIAETIPTPKDKQAGDNIAATIVAPAQKDAAEIHREEQDVPDEWEEGQTILDLYEVKKVHTGGGMGLVYRVFHRDWEQDIAVKSPRAEYFQNQEQKENFVRECLTWIGLGLHEHIACCYYVRMLGNIPKIFAEYVEGGSLKEWIENRKLYEGGEQESVKRILDIAIQAAWGLQHAHEHEQGFIHRDIKPANILLTPEGIAKITDFGLAKARAATAEKKARHGQQSILASLGEHTPAYCSPEQAQIAVMRKANMDEKMLPELTCRSDIWSWGLSVLEMFSGGVFWQAGQLAPQALQSYLENGPEETAIPRMPRTLAELLNKCFQASPDDRPKDMTEVIAALKQVYEQAAGSGYSRATPEQATALADALSNQGTSLIDLGYPEQAEAKFEEALKADPLHPEVIYNRGLFLWRSGRMTDAAMLTQLRESGKHSGYGDRTRMLAARVHIERVDAESAVKELEAITGEKRDSGEFKRALAQAQSGVGRWGRRLRMFEGHTEGVRSVAISPDGRWGLSGSGTYPSTQNCELRLWEFSTGRCLRTFEGHTNNVNSVAISPDGRWGLSGSGTYPSTQNCELHLWELLTGRCLRTFEGHTQSVTSVAISPDGRWGLSGSYDKTLRLWELSTGRCLRTFEGHRAEVYSVAISPDGRWGLSGSSDKTLHLWELPTGRCLRTFEGHTNFVRSVAISPDGRWGLSGSPDNTLRLWELSTGRSLRTFEGHTNFVMSVAISPDGRWGLSGSSDKTLRMWELSTGRCLRTFEGHNSLVLSVAISPDGRWGLSGSSDKTLRLWELSTIPAQGYTEIRPHSARQGLEYDRQANIAMSRAKSLLVAGDIGGALESLTAARKVPGYAQSPDVLELQAQTGSYCRRTGMGGGWCLWTLKGHSKGVTSVAISPDGRWGLSGSDDRTLCLWELSTGQYLRTFEGHTGNIHSVAISPDGRWGLSGSYGNKLRLWELSTGRCLRTFEGCNSFAISPDGRWVLSRSGDRTLRLNGLTTEAFWTMVLSRSDDRTLRLSEFLTGRCLRTFEGHSSFVLSVAISPDGRWVLSGSEDKTLRLWEFSTGRCLRTFEGHTDQVNSVAISPDGRWVLSGSDDRTLRLWELNWEYEFPGWSDWDEGAKPYLDIFLTLHCPYGPDSISKIGKPSWNDEDFKRLLKELQYRGYGWLKPDGVRKKLEEMTANWQGSPPLSGE